MKFFCVCLSFIVFLFSCRFNNNSSDDSSTLDSAFIKKIIAEAPPLSPSEALSTMVVEEGFEVKLVASEPLLNSPVALNFDQKGRIWIVEMEGYMPDSEGYGEGAPNGKIVILEDKNNDGAMDERKVFLDSLVLPRALCLVDDGILVAEPPYLWYFQIENDKPIKKSLIDSNYTEGGNVEAQSNGLYRAMDNWIYSGGSNKRYRKVGGTWFTESTHLRGQWGISQDDYGRLFYNNNSQNLLGDLFSPGLGSNNPNKTRIAGFNEKIVADVRVFPIRPTPGVNRGYQDNVLDDSLRLKTFTAASGPVIYRGDLFGADYYNNAFVGEPAANLIKRNILKTDGFKVTGEPAYEGKEFLASYDERFRPVSLYNGPDGALYIVDMYRGIIQHKLFLTDYLKDQIGQRLLENPINYGRIYKVVPKNKIAQARTFPTDPVGLVDLLNNRNGWIRDKAQQIIIDRKLLTAIPLLKKNLKKFDDPILLIHSLWTLEGLNALKAQDVLPLLSAADRHLRVQGLTALSNVINSDTYKLFASEFTKLIDNRDSLSAPYIAFQAHGIEKFDKNGAKKILFDLATAFPNNEYVVDAILTNIKSRESEFRQELLSMNPDTALLINKKMIGILADIKSNENNKDFNQLRKKYSRGVSLFRSTCQPCHGADGNGIELLAPPLNNSDWVTGNKDRLIATVLFGLRGPIKVNGKLYDKINGEMPAIGNNKDVVDEDIAQLLSFIRNYWSNSGEEIKREEVIRIRRMFKDRNEAFTMQELDKL